MTTKTAKITAALAVGNTEKAISIASKFFDRGEDSALFKQAQGAINNRSFYTQIGKDPDEIIHRATKKLIARFGAINDR